MLVGQNVGCALSGEVCGSDGKQIGPTTETVSDERDAGVASRRDQKRAKVVDNDGDARTVRERHRGDWPPESQWWGFPCLALQAVAKPPPGAYAHTDPPVEPLERAQSARGAKVAEDHK